MSGSIPTTCEAVFWDFGMVLIGWNPYGAVESRFSREEWDDFVVRGEFYLRNHRADWGNPRQQEIDALHAIEPHLADVYRAYVENYAGGLVPELPANRLVAALAEAGVPQYGITNWSAEEIEIAPRFASGIALLGGYVVSGIERVAKPDPRIFEIALDRYGVPAERALFVDDVAENCEAAAALGMMTHHHVGEDAVDRLEALLVALGLLPA